MERHEKRTALSYNTALTPMRIELYNAMVRIIGTIYKVRMVRIIVGRRRLVFLDRLDLVWFLH